MRDGGAGDKHLPDTTKERNIEVIESESDKFEYGVRGGKAADFSGRRTISSGSRTLFHVFAGEGR